MKDEVLRIEKLSDPLYEEVRYYKSGKQEYIKRKNTITDNAK